MTASKASSFAGLQNPIYNWRPKETPALNSQSLFVSSFSVYMFLRRCISMLRIETFFSSLNSRSSQLLNNKNGNRITKMTEEKKTERTNDTRATKNSHNKSLMGISQETLHFIIKMPLLLLLLFNLLSRCCLCIMLMYAQKSE